jgi:signal transduction histidine kinase/PAS domain-containing protein
MALGTDPEILERTVLRDLVALSTIPAAWVGRDPPAVAAGLADTLVGLLGLDFAFVRLCDPGGAGAVDVARGDAWKQFPRWLERHVATRGGLSRRTIVPEVGDGPKPCRGVVIPIGVTAAGGLVAASCGRTDFPTEADQLLLSLAANHAATAFQSARLIHEREAADEELRKAHADLELKVVERTADLARTEAYLAEAQKLTHTGSFAIDIRSRAMTHSSDENSRLYGFNPNHGVPPLERFVERIHADDREICIEALEAGVREATTVEVEYRVVLPQSPVRRHRAIAHPIFTASGDVAEIVGTIADVTDRRRAEAELERLAGEQAALRRVATLVARKASQSEVFTAIAEGVGQLLGAEEIRMLRYDEDRSAVVVASAGETEDVFPVGSRQPLGGENAASRVFRTARPARIDDYGTASGAIAAAVRPIGLRCVVAAPILVEGRLWGAMATATTRDEPLPPETESRLEQFTELMATAIANMESHAKANRLTEEQAALRRVAVLVAEGAPPTPVFAAVAAEMERLLDADGVTISRYEPIDEVTVVAHHGSNAAHVPPGTRVRAEAESVTAIIRRTERPARLEHYEGPSGAIAQLVRTLGVRAAVGAPIVVDGRLWGSVIATWKGEESPPSDTEERMAQFAELLDTAIANADGRDQLDASRARLLTEADAARRRVVRDLHDGAQQRLVHAIITLKLAQRALRENAGDPESLVRDALEHAEQGNVELRELAHGILPAILTHGGLPAGVQAVVSRLDLPVEVDVPARRFPADIEASAYFIIAEALTNVVKHAGARHAAVRASAEDGTLHVEVHDDGTGGADPDGHGLVGVRDRVTALGGRLRIESPAGGGTLVAATLPLSGR